MTPPARPARPDRPNGPDRPTGSVRPNGPSDEPVPASQAESGRPPLASVSSVRVSPPVTTADGQRRLDGDLDLLEGWLRDYVGRPHSRIGRRGPVCPFVPPALDSGAMQFSLHYDITDAEPARIRKTVEIELVDFGATTEPELRNGSSLSSRIVVFPSLGDDGWRGLDEVYQSLKCAAVTDGLMTGQFHPLCDERAARNPEFPVSVSPVGLYAIRRMAPHDILFLHERADWFAVYDRLFRSQYEAGRVRDTVLTELYQRTLTRHDFPPLTRVTEEPPAPADRPE